VAPRAAGGEGRVDAGKGTARSSATQRGSCSGRPEPAGKAARFLVPSAVKARLPAADESGGRGPPPAGRLLAACSKRAMNQPRASATEGALPERTPSEATAVLVELGRAVKARSFYAAGEPEVRLLLSRAWRSLHATLLRHGPLEVGADAAGLQVPALGLRVPSVQLGGLAQRLAERRVRSLRFDAALDADGLAALVDWLAADVLESADAPAFAAGLAERGVLGVVVGTAHGGAASAAPAQAAPAAAETPAARAAATPAEVAAAAPDVAALDDDTPVPRVPLGRIAAPAQRLESPREAAPPPRAPTRARDAAPTSRVEAPPGDAASAARATRPETARPPPARAEAPRDPAPEPRAEAPGRSAFELDDDDVFEALRASPAAAPAPAVPAAGREHTPAREPEPEPEQLEFEPFAGVERAEAGAGPRAAAAEDEATDPEADFLDRDLPARFGESEETPRALPPVFRDSDATPASLPTPRVVAEDTDTEAVEAAGAAVELDGEDGRPGELEALLRELAGCEDDFQYHDLARRAEGLAGALYDEGHVDLGYRALTLFASHAGDDGKRSPLQRDAAADHLQRLASGARLAELIDRACAPDGETSLGATQVLMRLGTSVVPVLFRAAEREAEPTRRGHLHGILIAMGDVAFPEVMRAMESGEPARVRAAVRLAGEMQSPRAVEPLAELLEGPAPALRQEAAKALVRIGDARAVDALVRALESPVEGVPNLASYCLGAAGSARAADALVAALRRSLVRRDLAFALELVRALGRLARPEPARELAALTRRGGLRQRRAWRELRVAAVNALGRLPGEEALAALGEAARARDADVRRAAEAALERRASPAAR